MSIVDRTVKQVETCYFIGEAVVNVKTNIVYNSVIGVELERTGSIGESEFSGVAKYVNCNTPIGRGNWGPGNTVGRFLHGEFVLRIVGNLVTVEVLNGVYKCQFDLIANAFTASIRSYSWEGSCEQRHCIEYNSAVGVSLEGSERNRNSSIETAGAFIKRVNHLTTAIGCSTINIEETDTILCAV